MWIGKKNCRRNCSSGRICAILMNQILSWTRELMGKASSRNTISITSRANIHRSQRIHTHETGWRYIRGGASQTGFITVVLFRLVCRPRRKADCPGVFLCLISRLKDGLTFEPWGTKDYSGETRLPNRWHFLFRQPSCCNPGF